MTSAALSIARRRTSIRALLAVLAALTTSIAVYSYLSWLRAQIPITGKLVSIVVASHDLPPGTQIGAGDIELTKHPEKYLPAGALRTDSAVIGKTAAVPIYKGEPLTIKKVGASGGFSSMVPPGMRAYSLRIDSGTSSALVPQAGDRVDVIVTFAREVLGEPSSMTVLRGSVVASIGGPRTQASGKVAGSLGIRTGEGSSLSVTLFVTPQEAEKLAMAESLGRITLVLAPIKDLEESAPKPIKPQDLATR